MKGTKAPALAMVPLVMLASIGAANAKTTLTYWEKWGGTDQQIIMGLIDRYNKSQAQVQVKYVNTGGSYDKYLAACAAGKPPDLVGAWNHTLPLYVLNGVAEPLDSYLKLMNISQRDLIPNYWEMMSYKGKVYGMPVKPASFATFWNKDMFAAAGLDPSKAPKTMEDLLALNPKLTKKDAIGKLKQFGYSPSLPGWYAYMWPTPFGADLYNEAKETMDLTQPGMYRATRWIKDFSDSLGGPKGVATFNGAHLGNTGPFISGKMGIDLMGAFYPSYLSRLNPKLQYGVDALPMGQGGESWSWIEGDVVFLPKGGRKNKEAAKFLGWLMSAATQQELNLSFETFSAVKGVNSGDFMRRNRNPFIAEFVQSANSKKAAFTPRTTAWQELSDRVVFPLQNDVFAQKKSPEQAIKELQGLANSITARAQKRTTR